MFGRVRPSATVDGLENDVAATGRRATFTLHRDKADVLSARCIQAQLRCAYRLLCASPSPRRHHVEPIASGLLRHLDQQGLVARSTEPTRPCDCDLSSKFCAVLGHDVIAVAFEVESQCGRVETEPDGPAWGLTAREWEQAKTGNCDPTGACQPGHGNFPRGTRLIGDDTGRV